MASGVEPSTGDVMFFGPFRLVGAERSLVNDSAPVAIGGRALDLLIALTKRAGEVLSSRELLDLVWPDVVVEEANLRAHIATLRKVLGDGKEGARYIVTVPGRGYAFVAPVSRLNAPGQPATETGQPVTKSQVSHQLYKLPACLTRMVGRDDTVRDISARLAAKRFVTIVGPGGIGKTTVAVSIGHLLLGDFERAVCFFDLGPVNDPLLVPSAVASNLGLQVLSADPTPSLINFLRDKRMLLILDSCEHVIESVAVLAERIFAETAQVYILATSREVLRVEGEHVQYLPPLQSPPDNADLTAAQVLTFSAAQLFAERATASNDHFALMDADASTVGEICRTLDGMALAIELAAGRVSVHGIRETAALLNERFNLHWEGRRSAPPRQRTLRAMLDWSYDLLPDSERAILRRLAVFVGPFSLEAARSIAAGGDVDRAQVGVAVASLVRKSLVTSNTGGAATRYRLLDTTRAYALGKLVESDEADPIARNHVTYYCDLLERANADLTQLEGLASLAEHLANVRVALEWSFSEGSDATLGVSLAAASAPLFLEMSLVAECSRWSQRAVAALDDTTRGTRQEVELQADLGLALMFSESNSERARIAFLRGLEVAEERKDLPNQLRMLSRLHIFHYRTGDLRTAHAFALQGELVAKQIDDPVALATGHALLGVSCLYIEDLVAARTHLEAALEHVPLSPRVRTFHFGFDYRSHVAIILARALWLLGYPDQAASIARWTADEAWALDHSVTVCIAHIYAVSVFLWIGDWKSAGEFMDKLVAHARRRSIVPYEVAGRGVTGFIAIKLGDAKVGLPMVRDSLEILLAQRYQLLTTLFNSVLAEGLAMTGQYDQALKMADETIGLIQQSGDLLSMAELLRIKAEILSSMPHAQVSLAEDCFLSSLELARRRSVLAWELRTATSLARFWFRQGRLHEARDLLKPVYDRFTEGFETPDLVAAQRLLNEIGPSED